MTQGSYKMKKKNSMLNTVESSKIFTLSLKTQSKIKKYKKINLTVNEIFEDFTNKFHYIYFQNICDQFRTNTVSILNENYHSKLEEYFKYEDDIEELYLMLNDGRSDYLFR